jgi:2-polyprenyl-3-methyl-5-hydroxy-6-metoxy-1,4-benzoquinol methylase
MAHRSGGVPETGGSRPCRLCGAPSSRAFVVGDRNRGLGPEQFEYRRCGSCRSVFIERVPADLGRYYAADGYGSVTAAESAHVMLGEQNKLELLQPLVSERTLVEIGPGPGTFTRAAQRAGFEVTAIEMDERYCRELSETLGIRAINSDEPASALATLEPQGAIVMWHAIEHLPQPWRVLEACRAALRPGGVLAISTPNPDSLQFRLLGRYWGHLDAPRHLQLLPAATLRAKAEGLGLRHALTTTTDQVGLDCNRLGWELAVRRHPARHRSSVLTMSVSGTVTRALAGVEAADLRGSTYTSLFQLPTES